MKRMLTYLTGVLLCGTALWIAWEYDPTRITRGLLLREEFFQNRPTSYWREVIQADMEDKKLQKQTINRFKYSYAMPVLRECLSDPDPDVRWASLLLFSMNASTRAIKPAATRALDDPDKTVKFAAIEILRDLKYEASLAVPKFYELTSHSDKEIAFAAHRALWEINPERAVEAGKWREFISDEWQFNIMFPGVPKIESTSVEGLYGEIKLHYFSVPFSQAACMVVVAENPIEVLENFSIDERHRIVAEDAAFALEGELIDYTSFDRQPNYLPGADRANDGRNWTVEVTDEVVMHSRVFQVEDRCYRANFIVPYGRDSPEATAYFLDSFQVDYPAPK